MTVGVDVDADLHILAKANMLLHLAEQLRDSSISMAALNDAMADTFVLMNRNQTLGALESPPVENVDVVLTNPPYVTEGSAVYREELKASHNTPAGITLADYYEGCGLGVESLFMRLIVGALKRGGRAFVVVPMGFLNRTSGGPKQRILDECDVICSIALPRSAFFNTLQPVYILGLQKRHSPDQHRPMVMCGLARTIGETLDYMRIPAPDHDDLDVISHVFVALADGNPDDRSLPPFIKLADPSEFAASDRWDVVRFWDDDELVALGQKTPAVSRVDFIDDARDTLDAILADFDDAKRELEQLNEHSTTETFSLADADRFLVRSGTRITNTQILENPGTVPVYSCFTNPRSHKGLISADWLAEQDIRIEDTAIVTIMANGAKAVGRVFVREPNTVITDDVIAVEALTNDIDLDYLAVALRSAIAAGAFVYEAKLFARRVRELKVQIPATGGVPDLGRQRKIAAAVKRFDSIRERLAELGAWSLQARIR